MKSFGLEVYTFAGLWVVGSLLVLIGLQPLFLLGWVMVLSLGFNLAGVSCNSCMVLVLSLASGYGVS